MRYEAPNTIEKAVALLASEQEACQVLAGGTDLLVRMRSDMASPDVVVDIKKIEGMKAITREEGGWRIGAGVSGAEMGEHDALSRDWPGIVEAVGLIGSTQIQGRATPAGNLCNASPAADSVPAMVAAGAIATIAGPSGVREVPVVDVPQGPGKTCLQPGEFISSIFLPDAGARAADAYLRFIPRTEMDIAVVGCGVCISVDADGKCIDARVALGAVGPTVMLVDDAGKALVGTSGEDAALAAVAEACSAAARPIDDKRGTQEFRKHVAGVLAKRAALKAFERARNK